MIFKVYILGSKDKTKAIITSPFLLNISKIVKMTEEVVKGSTVVNKIQYV